MFNLKETIGKFVDDSKRIFIVSRKPSKSEYLVMLKVTAIGIAIVGVIGFIITLIFSALVFPAG